MAAAAVLSDRARKWVRRFGERLAGTAEDGERAPARLREQVVAFANFHPRATREAWANFASSLAEDAYEGGYVRGLEWSERAPAETGSPLSPEELADRVDPGWLDRPFALEDPGGIVGDEGDDAADIVAKVSAAINVLALKERFPWKTK